MQYLNVVMKNLLQLSMWFVFFGCANAISTDVFDPKFDVAELQQGKVDSVVAASGNSMKLSVLVLPPFDSIANEGISPNIQKSLERVFFEEKSFDLIQFPYGKLVGVPYQNVFDKRYCKPITAKVKSDIIVMTKIGLVKRMAEMEKCKWDMEIKIYNIISDRHFLSKVEGRGLTSLSIDSLILARRSDLFEEVLSSR